MSDLQLPVFDFSAPLSVSLEEMDKAETKGSKFLRPGLYTAKIVNVEYKGKTRNDEGFGNFSLTYGTADDKTIRQFVTVPLTSRMAFNGSKGETLFVTNKAKRLLAAAGLKIDSEASVKAAFSGAFADPSKSRLLNKEVSIKVGYNTPYVAMTGKDTFVIRIPDGTEHPGFIGRTWGDKDTLLAEAQEANVKLAEFPEVIEVSAVERASKASTF